MVPRKVVHILKIAVIITLFLLINLMVKSIFDHVHWKVVREPKRTKYFPVASLYANNVRPAVHHQCHDHVIIYNNVIVVFKNMTLDPQKAQATAQGGALVKDTVTQRESDEIFDVTLGFLSLQCLDNDLNLQSHILHDLNDHVKQWRDSIVINSQAKVENSELKKQVGLTVIIERNEYANVYWTLMDLYDVFITMSYLNHTYRDTHILLADARPKGHLDGLWHSFKSVKRLQHIKHTLLLEKVTWRYDRKHSPLLNDELHDVPLIDEFRQFVITSQDILIAQPKLTNSANCSPLRILFIWRHDYVAHPRNPRGKISRKITNEQEILNATRTAYPMHRITGAQLDNYDIKEQLTMIANCDIMIGMHGAAMAYGLMLPQDGAVVELFPDYYGYPNWHMKKLAKWSHHGYFRYRLPSNLDNTVNQTTVVPPDTVIKSISKASDFVCQRRMERSR